MRVDRIPFQHGVSWKEQKGREQSPDFVSIYGQKTPTKFEVGGIVVWQKDLLSRCTCIVVSTDKPNTNKDFVNITIKEHRTNDVFQPLKKDLISYGKDDNALFKDGMKLDFFHDYFELPLQFTVIQDMQKQNKGGMFSILAKEKQNTSSNPDEHVEIQTFSLSGLVLNKGTKPKRKHALMTEYSGGYNRGGGATSGSLTQDKQ